MILSTVGIKSILKKSKGQSGHIKQSKGETARQTLRPLLNEPEYYEDPQPRALLDDPPYVDEYPKRKPLLEEPSYYTDQQHGTPQEDSIGTYPKRNLERKTPFSGNQSQRPRQEEPSYFGEQQPRSLMKDPIYMDEHPKRGSLLGEPSFMGENPGGRQLLEEPSYTMKGNLKRRPLLEDPYSQQENKPLLETPAPYREDQQEIYRDSQPIIQPRLEDPYFVDEMPDKAPLFEDPEHISWRSKRRPLLEHPDKPRIKPLMEEQDYMAERRPLLQDPDYLLEAPRQTPLLEDPKPYTDGLSDHRRTLLEKPAYDAEQDERYGADNISG